jgi:hypothetical protein
MKTVYERCKTKSWWDKKITFKEFKGWLSYQIKLLSKLKGFEIIVLNNENDKYKELPFPPEF